jgi:hypothetical protein
MRNFMLREVFVFVGLLTNLCCAQQKTSVTTSTRALQVEELTGGSVVTNLGYGIQINKGSTLTRRWFVINDPSCPIRLSGTGINTVYESTSIGGNYKYKAAGTASATEPVKALEVRFLLFDIWGEHMRTLSDTEISDLTGQVVLKDTGSWNAWENDVSEMFTVVSFVSRARKPDGSVWEYDPASVIKEIEKIKISLTEKELAPEREKPKS